MIHLRFPLLCLLFTWAVATGATHAQTGEAELAEQYFQDGEYENALNLYAKIQKKDPSNRAINLRLNDCYVKVNQIDESVGHLERCMKKNPHEYAYPFVLADAYRLKGDLKSAENLENTTLEKQIQSEDGFMQAGSFLFQTGRNALALRAYLQSRKTLKSKYLFSAEIAHLHSLQGNWREATKEYLLQYELNPGNASALTNSVLNLVGPQSGQAVEEVLLDAVNKAPSDIYLRNMLYEYYVLTENFMEAFVQCKSIDKVFHENGMRVFKFAETLRNNKQYKLANKALDYVIENHQDSPYFLKAYQDKAVNGEFVAFQSIPLDTAAIREAVLSYDQLLERFGRKAQFFDAMYRKSNLLAFYLFDLETARAELENISKLPVKPAELAEANLLMGDVFLMQKNYNKAVLKYDEVAEAFKEGQTGALAKFKQGRLSYFKGDFEFAKARLQTIKDNTSNDISNDAIRLFLLIQDNLGMDTSTFALQRFAQAQLMAFQRDYEPSLTLLDSIAYAFPNNTLADEILWEKANIFIQQNKIEQALTLLDKISAEHATDIYGDDALFTKAKIFDYTFKDPAKAMTLYIEFLRNYSSSLYVVEVRKRIRELRSQQP